MWNAAPHQRGQFNGLWKWTLHQCQEVLVSYDKNLLTASTVWSGSARLKPGGPVAETQQRAQKCREKFAFPLRRKRGLRHNLPNLTARGGSIFGIVAIT